MGTKSEHPRMARERKTVKIMIGIYCNAHHNSKKELCKECRKLQEYAMEKLDKCPFQETKSTCAKCTIHCYKDSQKEQIREVMAYSGPRMLFKHPVLAVLHLGD